MIKSKRHKYQLEQKQEEKRKRKEWTNKRTIKIKMYGRKQREGTAVQ